MGEGTLHTNWRRLQAAATGLTESVPELAIWPEMSGPPRQPGAPEQTKGEVNELRVVSWLPDTRPIFSCGVPHHFNGDG